MSTTPDVTVTQDVAAPAEAVWALVSDLTRMGEWSPETEEVEWLGGATEPAVGAKFRGSNRNGSRSWKTTCVITTFDPGRRLVFTATVGPIKVADWGYEVTPTDGGCQITETWTDRRSGFVKALSKVISGVDEREPHNRDGMEQTLGRIAAAAEGQAA